MSKVIDIHGQKFYRLEVVKFEGVVEHNAMWKCVCDCGNTVVVKGSHLRDKNTKSCGCYMIEKLKKINTTHGKSKTPLYVLYRGLVARCLNKNHSAYYRYGGRGIKVCDRWLKYENFYEDMEEGYTKHCEVYGRSDTSIDRVNNNGDYCKDNCKWVTRTEQQSNTRRNKFISYSGETLTVKQWSKRLNIRYTTLWQRLYKNKWTVEKSFTKSFNRVL